MKATNKLVRKTVTVTEELVDGKVTWRSTDVTEEYESEQPVTTHLTPIYTDPRWPGELKQTHTTCADCNCGCYPVGDEHYKGYMREKESKQ